MNGVSQSSVLNIAMCSIELAVISSLISICFALGIYTDKAYRTLVRQLGSLFFGQRCSSNTFQTSFR